MPDASDFLTMRTETPAEAGESYVGQAVLAWALGAGLLFVAACVLAPRRRGRRK